MADVFMGARRGGELCFALPELIAEACWDAAVLRGDGPAQLDLQLDRDLPEYVAGEPFGLRQMITDSVARAARRSGSDELAVRVELICFDALTGRAQIELHTRDAGEILAGRLTLHVNSVATEAGRAHAPAPRGAQAHVLVIDPLRSAARETAAVVFEMGHRVQMVPSVAAAMRAFRQRRFDLVLVDEATPDVARLSSSAGSVTERPAIIGLRGEGRGLRLLPEVDGWLPKPVAPDILHPAIASACGGVRTEELEEVEAYFLRAA